MALRHVILILLFNFFAVPPTSALEVAGIFFPETVALSGKALLLNGAGLRTATFLRVKVYAGALYLLAKTTDSSEALEAPYPKQIRMHFFRDVGAQDIQKAWDHSFAAVCEEKQCGSDAKSIEELKSLTVDVKEGDATTYTFHEGKVEMTHNEKKQGEILSRTFPKKLLATWIGKEPPTAELKQSLLGGYPH